METRGMDCGKLRARAALGLDKILDCRFAAREADLLNYPIARIMSP